MPGFSSRYAYQFTSEGIYNLSPSPTIVKLRARKRKEKKGWRKENKRTGSEN